MYILGLNAAYHDSSAVLVSDGIVIAACEEERFSRIKHAKRPDPFSAYQLPFNAIEHCLSAAGIDISQVDHIGYSFDPHLITEHMSKNLSEWQLFSLSDHEQWASAPIPFHPSFLFGILAAPELLTSLFPFNITSKFQNLQSNRKPQWHFLRHHLCHAASCFYVSPFEEAAILTLDGQGERSCGFYGRGSRLDISIISEIPSNDSIGLLYEQVTEHLGFQPSSDEYKVMALSAYGKPRFIKQLRDHVHYASSDGDYRIRPINIVDVFGPPRIPGSELREIHYDTASSIQLFAEELILASARYLRRVTGLAELCFAGGVALNCVANARLLKESGFRKLFIQPAANDAGTALGAALLLDSLQMRRQGHLDTSYPYVMEHTFLGPCFSDSDISSLLDNARLRYRKSCNIAKDTARMLAHDKIVGWFQGRMEFGPRALGARSILSNPMNKDVVQRLNYIKGREQFRPIAPCVLEERAGEYFVLDDTGESPFMLFTFKVREDRVKDIPAAMHVDGSSRIQTVRQSDHSLLYSVISEYNELSGIPVIMNTSFNTGGKPIVCTPKDAIETYTTSPMDGLVIGSFILEK